MAAGLTEPRCASERGLAMGGGRPAERRFTVGGSSKSVARCHRSVLAYWKMLWGGRRGRGNFVAASNRWSAAMPQPNDLSRSLVALDQNSTIIAVVELSQSSWLVGGVVP